MKDIRRFCTNLLCLLILVCVSHAVRGQKYPWQDTTLSLDERVEWLIGHLTLDEKLSLMVHQNPAIERVGLPAYSWWNEALHGVGRAGEATVYPMPIALAATFHTEGVRYVFADVAFEARQKYLEAQDTGYCGDYAGLTFFTPNINIFRDPRWGRGMETYGEDPYLTALMGQACVEGLQHGAGGDSGRLLTAACLKHLAVHSGPEGVRHEFDSRVSARDLRTTYLPAFEYIIKHSDVRQVMCGYNRLNGEPCCTNRELLVDILRQEWGYSGLLVTDCWALNDTYELDTVIPRHRTHASAALAYGDAFGTEVDLECGSGLPALRQAVELGYVSQGKIDEHVRRLLRTRLEVVDGAAIEDEHDGLNPALPLAIAKSSLVLLKNNNVLPMERGTRLYLCGPNATDSLMPLGNYNGTPRHTWTIAEGLARSFSLVGTADSADVVVYAGGLSPQLEGEELQVDEPGFYRGDRTQIELPARQRDELHALRATGKPVVLLLCTGSALGLEEVADDVDAIMVTWYGGQEMGRAVAEAMCRGYINGSFGRLPITFYRSTAQLPPFEDYNMDNRTYRYLTTEPLYPFGYGLDYLPYSIELVDFDSTTLTLTLKVAASEGVVERGVVETKVQVYLSYPDAGHAPRRQLVGLGQKKLWSGESAELTIHIDPFWMRLYDENTGRMQSPAAGTRAVLGIGKHSADKEMINIEFRTQ